MGDKREEYYDKAGVGSCYLFRLDEDCIVDATRRGHIGRFINHCCSPNAYAKTVEIGPHTRKIVIIALKDIKAGEEVMYDYKFPIEDDKIPCYKIFENKHVIGILRTTRTLALATSVPSFGAKLKVLSSSA